MTVIEHSEADDERRKFVEAMVAAGDVLAAHLAAALKERDEARQQLQGAVKALAELGRYADLAPDDANVRVSVPVRLLRTARTLGGQSE